ncbi:MAG: alpha/beta fold hydrolase [Candidatus Marinimicrobia bacterium]|nr:alpha/beta fold hydrolase [Candidatus Neomarinimicrobiota bacterium]
MKILKLILFSLFWLLFLTIYPSISKSIVLANTALFQDDFNDGNADGWEEINGTGGWEVINNEYVGTVKLIRPERPAMSFAGKIEWIDYRFDFDIKSTTGVDKGVMFRYQDLSNYYVLNIRSMSQIAGGNDIVFQKIIDNQAQKIYQIPFVSFENTWYHVTIILNGKNIKIFIDNNLKIDYSESEDVLQNGKIGLVIWPGGHTSGDGDVTTLVYDNIVISYLKSTLDPIILLPGLGASWNHEAMILGKHKEPQDWYMTPFVKNYDGLIQTLKNSGYRDTGDSKNLFIFNYDWRQPIETIAEQLKYYINDIVRPLPGIKIDLIGHSLGGMVARTYVQNNPEHQIDQLITLGSPHHGVPQIYYLWEGADLQRTLLPWQAIPAGILVQLNKTNYDNNVETIQQALPGLKDLLPTFPYLKMDGVEKPFEKTSQRNTWLENFNSLPLPVFLTSVLNNFIGLKENTLRWINIVNRNTYDKFLERWVDGKPVGEEYEIGDGSVLAKSAQLEGAKVIELNDLNHGDLVESIKGQQAITNLLQLSPTSIIPAPSVVYEPSLIFQVASPANLTVLNPDGTIFTESQKLVFISNPEEGIYQVKVNPENEGGPYRLVVGKITLNNESWIEFSGQVSIETQTQQVVFSTDSTQIKKELLDLSKKRLISAKLKAEKFPLLFKNIIFGVIKINVTQIEKIIALFEKGKENLAQHQTKQTIINIIFFQNNLKLWFKFYPPEIQEGFLDDLRLAEDYLLQAYELE